MRLFFVITAFVVMLSISVACDNPKSNTDEFLIGDDDFSVTFVLNNGDDNVVWHKGDDLPAPTKKDCEFLYWCKDEELTVKADLDYENLILEQNLTLYAKWKELIDLEGVVFADVTCVYDGEAHSVKVDESTLPDGATVTYDGENSFVNAGEYVVSATIKADGYKDLVISATLKITKAKLVGITFPKVEAEWDGNKHSAFIKYTGGEFPSEVKVTYDGNGQAEVGNHKVTAKFEVSDNYEPIADMTALLVIKEKYFNVTFDDEISNIISCKVAHGQTLSDIPNPTAKDGYSARWNVENFENILADVNVKAIYTPIEYTISFISDDSVVATKKYDVEKSVDFDNISKQHYVFNGWYADKNRSGESVANLAIGNFGDKRFYAKWSAVEYFVTFHTYDGTNVESNTNCGERYKYTVESDSLTLGSPVKSNYTFGGWYVNENFEGESVAMIVKGASGNLDLYAKWIACEYSIAYDYRDGEICDNPTSYTVDSDDIILAASHKFGYDFVGWIDGEGNKVEVIRKGSSGNLILHAEWSPIEFSIVLNGANGSRPTTLTYTIENKTVTLPKIARAGYTLAGWFDEDGNKYETVSGSTQKNVSLTAKWNVVSYAINYEYDGGTQVDNPTSYTIDSEDIILAASHKFGYEFVGWIDGEGNKVEVIRKGSSGNLILHAEWSPIEFSIVLNGANGSRPTTLTYTIENKTVTLPKIARAGYTFVGWFDEDGKKYETVSGSTQKDVSLTAKWNVVSYTINYEYNGGTQVDNPTSYTVDSEDIILSASHKFGYDFVGWIDGAGNKVEVIRKGSSGNLILHAEWSPIEFSIVLNGANGSRPTTLTYTIEDETVTLPKIARAGYTFAGWFDEDGNKYETVPGTTQKDITLTAKWNVVSYAIKYEYDGGTQVDNPTSYTIEDEIVLIASEKDGYDFDGWFNGENKTEKIEKGSYGDITLTAHWTKRIIKSDFVIENGVLIGYTGANLSIKIHSSEAGQTVTSVAATAFDSVRASVTQIVIEEGIQSVERGAFDGMTTLKTLSLPSTISTLHRGMLKDCASLESLTIPFASFVIEQNINDIVTDENAALSATVYDDTSEQGYAVGFTYLFGKPSNEDLLSKYTSVNGYYKELPSGSTLQIDQSVETWIPNSLKYLTVLGGNILMKGFSKITSLQYVVLKNVSNVGQQAFIKCGGLKEVTIESENTTFGGAVFAVCSNMTIYVASQEQKTALDSQIQSLENVECAVASN